MALNKESNFIPKPPPQLMNSDNYLCKQIVNKCIFPRIEINPEKEIAECCVLYLNYIPEILFYRSVHPILQDGPTCGIVALSMASTLTENYVNSNDILMEAKNRNFTNRGEMFSVHNMAILAKEFVSLNVEEITNLKENRNHIFEELIKGSVLLIPYDSDGNNAPCLKRGHKAHWAAICGLLRNDEQYMVAARQGKSRRISIWDWDSLEASNDNLYELDPIRAMLGFNYVLPYGGVEAGLRNQALLIKYQKS